MKITNLIKINILNEMAGTCLNRHVDNNFYDFYFEHDMKWLLDNWEKIYNDFYNLDTTFERKNGILVFIPKCSKNDVLNIIKEEY